MTNNEEYEKALNDSFNAYRNYPKDTYAQIPAGYSIAFNYGYSFGLQQANAEQKEIAESQLNFQREQIATAAMQGLLTNATVAHISNSNLVAQEAVKLADALINELNKPKDENNN